jgi:hypothetical protein
MLKRKNSPTESHLEQLTSKKPNTSDQNPPPQPAPLVQPVHQQHDMETEKEKEKEHNPFKNIEYGGGYAMYNNKKYKICTGKRGGKYIRVGVDKKKIYV